MNKEFWSNKRVLVTGGASFIGSHLCDALLERDVKSLLVIDNLSSGKVENIRDHIQEGKIELRILDLREPNVLRKLIELQRPQIIFHLAADHGGRGYVDLHNAQCANNLYLDGLVLHESARSKHVEKVVYASSGCVYPNQLQNEVYQELYLTEDLVGPEYLHPQNSDNMYGWAKLMAEMTLFEYVNAGLLKSGASCRYFTVYGPRGKIDHAVIAMLGRAFVKQEPFEVWGDGTQIRNWTYVSDIVQGTIRAAEYPKPYLAVNLGTQERITVKHAVTLAIANANRIRNENWKPERQYQHDMPTGPLNRVCDNSLAAKELDWRPQVMFDDGIAHTADWFFSNKDAESVTKALERATER